MNTSASIALEFDRICEVLAGLSETPGGRSRALGLEPFAEEAEVRLALDETSEARRLRDENHRIALGGLPDLEDDLAGLAIAGRSLPVESFVRLARAFSIVEEARRLLKSHASEAPLLAAKAQKLPDLRSAHSEIRLVIDLDEEAVRDDASRELERIRTLSRTLESRLSKLLDRVLAARESGKLLQEPLVTYRNGRPCVPVRAECKSQFPGIVHGASASGASLFIEPMATVEVNNEIAALGDREREEIRRILSALTESLRPRREELAQAVGILSELDLAQAKARLSELSRADRPEVTGASELRLEEARHPLLIPEIAVRAGLPRPASEPVPLGFGLSGGRRGLVFTGPNTGGKTVALKTAGLLALMAQSGLHVPARSSSVFPVLRSIFADIGDDQSIGSSLSTFSSHLAKVVQVERELEIPALVILDEVGTGTDPSEGGALGTALVEHFLERGALVLASTHHGQLKAYALTTEGVEAASFDFDPRTYAPTYRILEGAAGRSLAFEMAERLGLPKPLVRRARELQAERERQVSQLVSRLETEAADLEKERARMAEDRRAAEEMRLRLEAEAATERRERSDRLAAFRASLEEELEAARREIRELLAEARRAQKQERPRLDERSRSLSERIDAIARPLLDRAMTEALPQERERSEPPPEPLRPGSRVLVGSFGMEGEVERILGEEAEVRVRDKKLRLRIESLEALPPLAPASPAKGSTNLPESKSVPEELNLIGCTVEEAVRQADKFLDDAVLSEYRQVRLIHGHGTGRLKSALREWLSAHPQVAKLESDRHGGATVVELKD